MSSFMSRYGRMWMPGVLAILSLPLTAHAQLRWSLTFSNDSSLVAFSEGNNQNDVGRVRVHRVDNGQLVAQLSDRRFRSIAFSPKVSALLASGGNHGVVHLWDVETKNEVGELKGLAGEVTSVALSGDGRYLAGTSKGRMRLWDLETRKVVQAVDDGDVGFTGVSFSADGTQMAFCRNLDNQKSRVEVYEVATWKLIAMLRLAAEKLELSPNGKATTFAMATSFVPGKERVLVSGGICAVSSKEEAYPYEFACRPTGLVWSAEFDAKEAKLLLAPRSGYISAIHASPDGKHFAVGIQGKNYDDNHYIELRSINDGKAVWLVQGDKFDPLAVVISPDGKWVASSRFSTRLWHAETGEPVWTIPHGE